MIQQTIKQFTDDELKEYLITCDGKGKEFKEEVLEELLVRQKPSPPEMSVCGYCGDPIHSKHRSGCPWFEAQSREYQDYLKLLGT